MTFSTSLGGLRASQTDLSVVSNNIANANSIGFKKSRAQFGDVFALAPTQNTKAVAGQGVRLTGIMQSFTQGALSSTDRTLDLAIGGEGFFVVKGSPPREATTFTRNGAFTVNVDRAVVDNVGNKVQLLPVDAAGQVSSTAAADMIDFELPQTDPTDPQAVLSNITIANDGVVTATFSNGNLQRLGALAMASFPAVEGLRPIGDSHWQPTAESGTALFNQAGNGTLGTVRTGTLEAANIDLTEELVGLISAQRNFQANAKAIETANTLTQTIVNIR